MKNEIEFPQNLKRLRKKAGLTRRELAERLSYSDKAVEKWESGQSYPALPTLCKIAKVLCVSLEELIYSQEKEIRYFLGIDGGGTKTTFLLENASGKLVNMCELGASNPNDVGYEQCSKILRDGISQVTEGIDKREIAVFAGIAGGISEENAERIKKVLAGFEFGYAGNGSDVDNVLEMGLQGKDGIIIIAGTGSICFAQKNGKRKRVGGWGYLLDDGGSGYNLGREALVAAYRALDGRGTKTLLTKLLEEKLEKSLEEAIPEIYHGGKRFIADLGTCVFEACDKDDQVAAEILSRNMSYIAEMIQTAKEFISEPETPVVICGGLTRRSDLLEKYIKAYLPKECNLQFCETPVVMGAVMRARRCSMKEEDYGNSNY